MTTSATTPNFGVYLPQVRMDFERIAERTLAAEELGFDSVWLIDHLATPALPEADCLEAWTTATAVAVRTSRIRLGHLVLCDAFRHPGVLAKMAVSLDHISDGRLELGLGWGSVERELRAWGVRPLSSNERAARLGETLEVLSALFTGDPVTYQGRFHTLDGAVARPTPVHGRIPIHIGGAGKRLTLPLVARHADWWNCPSSAVPHLDELTPLVGSARVSVQHPVGLAASNADLDEVRAVTERRFGGWGGLVVGTPEEVATTLADEAARGVELFILQFSDFGTPETLERFARQVVPAVRERAAELR